QVGVEGSNPFARSSFLQFTGWSVRSQKAGPSGAGLSHFFTRSDPSPAEVIIRFVIGACRIGGACRIWLAAAGRRV
ncbi:hypothetical protein, partial [Azospirillum sp. B506]|uniref:hypothetical protein n=1 Tax=Azospirillum sp. B506 TaxID=137721 RepID=UPI001B3B78A6